MYKVNFSNNAYFKLDSFIDGFESTFIKMYTDTGIVNEDIIRNSYIELGNKFNDLIVDTINDVFSEEKILGISETSSKVLYSTISINNFRLFIYYSEDNENRYIKDIEFFRR